MNAAERAYNSLVEHLRRMALVASTQELLAWDELTLLPDQATEHRGAQLAHLAGLHHELAVDPRIDAWLSLVEGSPVVADPESAAATNAREARRQHGRLQKLPRSLVEELARVTTAAQHHWKLAREQNDFRRFEPWLAAVVVLKREEARCFSPSEPPSSDAAYDALLADYDPGLTTANVRTLFTALEGGLGELLPWVLNRQIRAPRAPQLWNGRVLLAAQRKFCFELAACLGFDFERGRLDEAVHPFTSHLGPHDCRLAIRYDDSNPQEALYALLHELGHGLYDQGLPAVHFGTPAGEGASLSVHESQARMWENAVGRSLGFCQFLLPRLRSAFLAAPAVGSAPELWRESNRVAPGVNRVASDEVTYNLHIMLRYEIEQALISGEFRAADVPLAWNIRHQELLGVAPSSDREGCLQDGHWAAGMFGYFPTYTVGNVLAAQLYEQATAQLGDLEAQFAAGDFRPLREWLAASIYRHGKRLTTRGLCRAASGSELNPEVLLGTLRARHEQLWEQ